MQKMWFGVTATKLCKGLAYDVDKWSAAHGAYMTYVSKNMSLETLGKTIETKTKQIDKLREKAIAWIKSRDVMPALNALRTATKLKAEIQELEAKELMLGMWRAPHENETTRTRKICTLISEMLRMQQHAKDALCVDEMLVLAAAHDLGCPFCGHYTDKPIVLKESTVEEPVEELEEHDAFEDDDYNPEEAYSDQDDAETGAEDAPEGD